MATKKNRFTPRYGPVLKKHYGTLYASFFPFGVFVLLLPRLVASFQLVALFSSPAG